MADIVKKNQAWAIKKEITEGVYLAPTVASDFIQVVVDGAEISRSKELLDRNVYTGSIGKTSPRTSTFQISGSISVEARANSVQGAAPEAGLLFESAMGDKRQLLAEETTGVGNTASVLQVTSANTKFAVGDIIMIKAAGAYHVSPVSAVSSTEVTLLIPGAAAFADAVKIAKHTTYVCKDSGHPSMSISRYLENAVVQKGMGCKVNSLALESFTTGQLANFNFGFEGLNFDSQLSALPVSPAYDSQLPPIVLSAYVFMGGTSIDVNELSFSLENTLAFKTATNAENGRIGSRPTERTITGSFNPFMQSDSMDTFNKYKAGTAFSIFGYMKLPTSTAGEYGGVVAFYMPNVVATELSEADQDGIMQDNISFSANRGVAGNIDELYITFI